MWILGHLVTPHDTAGDYDLLVGETPPKVPGPPPHLHNSFKEVFLVMEGEMEFMLDGKMRVVKAGESIDIPQGAIHTFGNKSDQPCKWVNIHSPKGFRSFFESYGVPASEPDAAQSSVDGSVVQSVIQKAADYDMHIRV